MKSQQSGFTLVEIAIVLVIIGLLLGGILKGQELINSAKVKNLANDFRTIPTYIYAYQDKFKNLPGDDDAVATHLGATRHAGDRRRGRQRRHRERLATRPPRRDESFLFWQHVRLVEPRRRPDGHRRRGLPPEERGGRLHRHREPRQHGRDAEREDQPAHDHERDVPDLLGGHPRASSPSSSTSQMDDGNTQTGSMRASLMTATATAIATASIDDATPYTVCMTF